MNFKTSYVEVYPSKVISFSLENYHFKTSYVEVYLEVHMSER